MAAIDLDGHMNGAKEAGMSAGARQDVLRNSGSETQKQAKPEEGAKEAGMSAGARQDVLRNSGSETQKQAKPEEGSKEYQIATDCYVHRFIVKVLGGVVGVALVGSFGLIIAGREMPDIFLAFGSGALGALAGLLAPPPSRQGGQSPVV